MVYSPFFRILLFALLVLLSVLLLRDHLKNSDITGRKAGLILLCMICLTFGIRLLYLRDIELDVDTSTWLSSVIAFNHYPDKLWVLLNYTDARPLTVFPLVIGNWFGMPVNYTGSEIIGLIMWLAIAWTLYWTCSFFAGRTTSLLIAVSLCLYVSTMTNTMAAYNSEHFSIGMLTLGSAGLISYIFGKWRNPLVAFLMGCLLGSVVYAKFQNVPMGIVTGAFLFFVMVTRKDWANSVLLICGSILPTLLVNMYYLMLGKLDVFWNSYFWNYFYYSYTTQFSSVPVSERFAVGRILRYIFYSYNSGFYFSFLVALSGVALLMTIRSLNRFSKNQKQILCFAILLLLSSLYAVLQSGSDFEHYKLYLVVPLLILAGILILLNEAKARKYLAISLVIGSLAQAAIGIHYLIPVSRYADTEALDQRIINSISKNSKATDPIVVWGWRDRLHVLSQRASGYRNVHPFHFSMKSPLLPYWRKDFVEDMEKNKPELFIEAMLPDYSVRAEYYLSHDKVPVVREYVAEHYFLLERLDGVQVFKRR